MAGKLVNAFRGMAREHLRACIKQAGQCLLYGAKHNTAPKQFLDPTTAGGNPVTHFEDLVTWAKYQLAKKVLKT